METQVLGISVDSQPCLAAWAESLGGITYPLLSDFYPHGEIARLFGVLRSDGTSERAIFVIDKKGMVRYIDIHDYDSQPNNDELFKALVSIDPVAAAAFEAQQRIEETTEEEPDHEVVMYCTRWCANCHRARTFFDENGIDYFEVDITRDRTAAARVRKWTGGHETTPTFKIKGEVIVDYKLEQIKEIFGIEEQL
ncbi:MAG: redoxin domain-containing protein [Anaerolineales bacterium]|nr:redoxin domain-containing protein [Anaerolineales bacterium]